MNKNPCLLCMHGASACRARTSPLKVCQVILLLCWQDLYEQLTELSAALCEPIPLMEILTVQLVSVKLKEQSQRGTAQPVSCLILILARLMGCFEAHRGLCGTSHAQTVARQVSLST